jgi:hypothetical protein
MKKTIARTDSKIKQLQSTDGAAEAEARELCGAYKPPKPENLEVGIEIDVSLAWQPMT